MHRCDFIHHLLFLGVLLLIVQIDGNYVDTSLSEHESSQSTLLNIANSSVQHGGSFDRFDTDVSVDKMTYPPFSQSNLLFVLQEFPCRQLTEQELTIIDFGCESFSIIPAGNPGTVEYVKLPYGWSWVSHDASYDSVYGAEFTRKAMQCILKKGAGAVLLPYDKPGTLSTAFEIERFGLCLSRNTLLIKKDYQDNCFKSYPPSPNLTAFDIPSAFGSFPNFPVEQYFYFKEKKNVLSVQHKHNIPTDYHFLIDLHGINDRDLLDFIRSYMKYLDPSQLNPLFKVSYYDPRTDSVKEPSLSTNPILDLYKFFKNVSMVRFSYGTAVSKLTASSALLQTLRKPYESDPAKFKLVVLVSQMQFKEDELKLIKDAQLQGNKAILFYNPIRSTSWLNNMTLLSKTLHFARAAIPSSPLVVNPFDRFFENFFLANFGDMGNNIVPVFVNQRNVSSSLEKLYVDRALSSDIEYEVNRMDLDFDLELNFIGRSTLKIHGVTTVPSTSMLHEVNKLPTENATYNKDGSHLSPNTVIYDLQLPNPKYTYSLTQVDKYIKPTVLRPEEFSVYYNEIFPTQFHQFGTILNQRITLKHSLLYNTTMLFEKRYTVGTPLRILTTTDFPNLQGTLYMSCPFQDCSLSVLDQPSSASITTSISTTVSVTSDTCSKVLLQFQLTLNGVNQKINGYYVLTCITNPAVNVYYPFDFSPNVLEVVALTPSNYWIHQISNCEFFTMDDVLPIIIKDSAISLPNQQGLLLYVAPLPSNSKKCELVYSVGSLTPTQTAYIGILHDKPRSVNLTHNLKFGESIRIKIPAFNANEHSILVIDDHFNPNSGELHADNQLVSRLQSRSTVSMDKGELYVYYKLPKWDPSFDNDLNDSFKFRVIDDLGHTSYAHTCTIAPIRPVFEYINSSSVTGYTGHILNIYLQQGLADSVDYPVYVHLKSIANSLGALSIQSADGLKRVVSAPFDHNDVYEVSESYLVYEYPSTVFGFGHNSFTFSVGISRAHSFSQVYEVSINILAEPVQVRLVFDPYIYSPLNIVQDEYHIIGFYLGSSALQESLVAKISHNKKDDNKWEMSSCTQDPSNTSQVCAEKWLISSSSSGKVEIPPFSTINECAPTTAYTGESCFSKLYRLNFKPSGYWEGLELFIEVDDGKSLSTYNLSINVLRKSAAPTIRIPQSVLLLSNFTFLSSKNSPDMMLGIDYHDDQATGVLTISHEGGTMSGIDTCQTSHEGSLSQHHCIGSIVDLNHRLNQLKFRPSEGQSQATITFDIDARCSNCDYPEYLQTPSKSLIATVSLTTTKSYLLPTVLSVCLLVLISTILLGLLFIYRKRLNKSLDTYFDPTNMMDTSPSNPLYVPVTKDTFSPLYTRNL